MKERELLGIRGKVSCTHEGCDFSVEISGSKPSEQIILECVSHGSDTGHKGIEITMDLNLRHSGWTRAATHRFSKFLDDFEESGWMEQFDSGAAKAH